MEQWRNCLHISYKVTTVFHSVLLFCKFPLESKLGSYCMLYLIVNYLFPKFKCEQKLRIYIDARLKLLFELK